MSDNSLIERKPLHDMAEQYQAATRDIEDGVRLMVRAMTRMRSAFGDGADSFFPGGWKYWSLESEGAAPFKKELTRKAWRSIVDRAGIRDRVSPNRREKIDEAIEKGLMPELTEAGILELMSDFAGNMDILLEETVVHAFKFLRRPHFIQYKSNDEFKIGKKAIISFGVSSWCLGKCRVGYEKRDDLISLDNAFHLLDGRGPVKYPGDIVSAINLAAADGQTCTETEYFFIKWYKNQNVHIEFRRPDLVDKINLIGGRAVGRELRSS